MVGYITPAILQPSEPPAITDVLRSAAAYAEGEKAPATRRAYGADWRHFSTWCHSVIGCEPLPAGASMIAGYLAHLADSGCSASTINRRLAAIGYAHRLKGVDAPISAEAVRVVLRGVRRRIGTAVTRKAPADARAIGAMLECVPDTLIGIRDRALLLLGFAAALRRSELVDLKVNDVELEPHGALIHIRRSKTDQEGAGEAIAVPRGSRLKPVEALEAWLAALTAADANYTDIEARFTRGVARSTCEDARDTSGSPIFRPIDRHRRVGAGALSDRSVAEIVKRYASAAGFDPKLFSGHSLRAGFVTSALEHGADIFKVMDVTRHRRVETLKGYDRRARAFRDHAGRDFL